MMDRPIIYQALVVVKQTSNLLIMRFLYENMVGDKALTRWGMEVIGCNPEVQPPCLMFGFRSRIDPQDLHAWVASGKAISAHPDMLTLVSV